MIVINKLSERLHVSTGRAMLSLAPGKNDVPDAVARLHTATLRRAEKQNKVELPEPAPKKKPTKRPRKTV